MGAFIYKPLLYCYIISFCYSILRGHAELVSAPHMPVERHAGCPSWGYLPADNLSTDYLSVGCRNKFGMTTIGAFMHPVHVATSNIEYNKTDGKLEVICTMFTDDLEAALAKQYKAKTDLNKPEMHAAMDALLKSYIAANLDIKADNVLVNLNYLGFEINREATDVYLESDKIPLMKKVDVSASLIYNLFDDQINIVHITVNGVRKSEKVDYPDKKVEQVF